MTPRSSLSNQQIRDERSDQILQAALKIFACKGFKATKISDIATQAAISQGLVHHYFASKDEVYIAVVERAMHGALDAVDRSTGPVISAWENLLNITGRILEGMRIHPEYMLVMIQSLVSQDVPPHAGKLIAQLGQQLNTRLKQFIRDGQISGEVTQGDPQELATILMSILQGLAITGFTGGMYLLAEGDLNENFQPSAEMVLRILKA